MTGSPSQNTDRPHHNQWLILIAAYKLLAALVFVVIGFGALRLIGQDIEDLVSRVAGELRFNPESRFVNFLLDEASVISDPMLRRIGFAAFAYAAVGILEAIGLYLEKTWGEYLTLIITASFLPFEIHEIIRRVSPIRVGLFVANVLVLVYLLKVVGEKMARRRAKEVASEEG